MALLEETELTLGLPGGAGAGAGGGNKVSQGGDAAVNGNGKRGYDETTAMDLKLKLSSNDHQQNDFQANNLFPGAGSGFPVKPPAKTQVVGWPPVRSYRKNMMSVKKSNGSHREKDAGDMTVVADSGGAAAAFVKVSMDGAPYLRKVDLKMYKSYQDFSDALGNMFTSFTIGKCGSQGMKEIKVMDLLNNSDYVPTYEDKDGDWMLLGDVPWEMIVDSCKRLRIMKRMEAIGIAPRAMEKWKNRS